MTQLTNRRAWVLVLLLIPACKRGSTPPLHKLGDDVQCTWEKRPMSSGCPIQSCGNSATIYGSYIEALDIKGDLSQEISGQDNYKLVRGTLRDAKGGCANLSDLSLDVVDGGFVGVAGGDLAATAPTNVKCSNRDLEGATVDVIAIAPDHTTRTLKLVIVKREDIDVWVQHQAEPASVPAYKLKIDDGHGHPEDLCKTLSEWVPDVRVLSTFPKEWKQPSDEAVLVQGEEYKPDATVQTTNMRWFNIGCAGSAMAEMRLLGVNPAGTATTADQRQTTLKMLTAKYCEGQSLTKTGTPIHIRGTLMPPQPPGGGGPPIGPVEALWGPNGATCVSHLRLWHVGGPCTDDDEAAVIDKIQKGCNIGFCEPRDVRPCEDPAQETAAWRTCTVKHIAHGTL